MGNFIWAIFGTKLFYNLFTIYRDSHDSLSNDFEMYELLQAINKLKDNKAGRQFLIILNRIPKKIFYYKKPLALQKM